MVLIVYINPLGWPLKTSQEEIYFLLLRIVRERILVTLIIFFSAFNTISHLSVDVGTLAEAC